MTTIDRAAQFAPFAALTGHDAAVRETARRTDNKVALSEDVQASLSHRLQLIAERINEYPDIAITYFQPDTKKQGGAYRVVTGKVKKMDGFERVIVMVDGQKVPIDDILSIEGTIFEDLWDEE